MSPDASGAGLRRTRFVRIWQAPLLVVSTFALLACASCSSTVPPPKFDGVLEAFSAPKPSAATATARPVDDVNVYVDISRSMKGFISSPQTNYVRVLEELIDGAQRASYEVQAFGFSAGVSPGAKTSYLPFLDERQYKETFTSLGGLLGEIVAAKRSGTLSVIVTDLVASQSTLGQSQLSAALQALATQGIEVKVLGFRSAFRGDYESESTPCLGQKATLSLGQSLPGLGRPFYALLLAPTPRAIEQWTRSVEPKLKPQVEFQPSLLPLDLEAASPVQLEKSGLRMVSKTQRMKAMEIGPTRRFYSSFSVDKPVGSASTFTLEWPAKEVFGVDTATLAYSVSCMRFSSKPKEAPAVQPNATLQIVPTTVPARKDGRIYLSYQFPLPDPGTWLVFRVQMRAGSGNGAAPRWISDWSANADCGSAPANRTYSLDKLSDSLMNAFARNIVFAEHYIAIWRK